MEFTIREPRVSDAEQIAHVLYAGWKDTYTEMLPAAYFDENPVEKWIESWQQSLTRAEAGEAPPDIRRRVACVEQAGEERVVGVAVSNAPHEARHPMPPVRDRELSVLYVLKEFHGTRIATELMNAVVHRDEPAELWVADPNPRAQAFYRKMGFEADGARDTFDWAPLTEIRMVR